MGAGLSCLSDHTRELAELRCPQIGKGREAFVLTRNMVELRVTLRAWRGVAYRGVSGNGLRR